MSADNVGRILQTLIEGKKDEYEYRPNIIAASEDLCDESIFENELKEIMKLKFGDSQVFLSLEEAQEELKRLYKEEEYVEYGIELNPIKFNISFPKNWLEISRLLREIFPYLEITCHLKMNFKF